MDQAAVQEERNAKKPPRTPKAKRVRVAVVGETSGSTWGQRELDKFHVEVQRGVSVHDMIPQEYWDVSNFPSYEECTSSLKRLYRQAS